MQPGQAVYARIAAQFGPSVVLADGSLNRHELARFAFEQGRVDELNAIVHPPVIAAQSEWLRTLGVKHPEAVAVVESALVLETRYGADEGGQPLPWRARFDRLVLVTAPENLRLDRYVWRVLASDPEAQSEVVRADACGRFAAQIPEAQKLEMADIVVENSGSKAQLHDRVNALYRQLRSEAGANVR